MRTQPSMGAQAHKGFLDKALFTDEISLLTLKLMSAQHCLLSQCLAEMLGQPNTVHSHAIKQHLTGPAQPNTD